MQTAPEKSPKSATPKANAFGAIAGSPLAFRAGSLDPRAFVFSIAAVAGAVVTGLFLWPWIGASNIALVFLTAVVGIAVQFGLWASLLTSVASSLCYNFFFTAPYYTFTIEAPTNIVSVVFFTVVAIVVSNLAAYARLQAVAAMECARTTELLHSFSRKLAGTGTLDDVLWATAYQTALMLKVRGVLLLPEGGDIVVKAGYPPEDHLEDADLAAARWAWRQHGPAGRGCEVLPEANRFFLPMRTDRGVIGELTATGTNRCSCRRNDDCFRHWSTRARLPSSACILSRIWSG